MKLDKTLDRQQSRCYRRVVELNFVSNNIVGELPDCLSELTRLRVINMPENGA